MANGEGDLGTGNAKIVENQGDQEGFFENPARSSDADIPMEQIVNDVEFIDPGYHKRYLKKQRTKKRFLSKIHKLFMKQSDKVRIHYDLKGHISTIGVDKGHEINIERSYTIPRQGELVIGMTNPLALADLLRDPSTTREDAFWILTKQLGLRIPSDEILRIVAKRNLGIGSAEDTSLDAILAHGEKLKEKLGEKFNDIEPAYKEVIKELLPRYDKRKVNDFARDIIVLAAIDFEENGKLRRGFYEYRTDGDSFYYADEFVEKIGMKKGLRSINWLKGFWKRYSAPYQFPYYFMLNRRKKNIGQFARLYRWLRTEKISNLFNKDRVGHSEFERSIKVINEFAKDADTKNKYPIVLMPDPLECVAAALFVNEHAYKDDSRKYVHLVPKLSKDPDENIMDKGIVDGKGFIK